MSKREDKTMPHVLLEVHINKNKEIESIEIIRAFTGGELGRSIEYSDDYCEYSLKDLLTTIEPDTLYHIYARTDWYECGGYEYNEWDSEITILNIIPVISNYEDFLDNEEKFEEQCDLEELDHCIDEIETNGNGEWSSSISSDMTYNEFESMAHIIAQSDIRLAHRVYPSYTLKEMLGELYNDDLAKIEKRRLAFKKFIKYNNRHDTKFTTNGYEIKYCGKVINISYESINLIPDDELMSYENSNYGLLERLIDVRYAPFVMEELANSVRANK